MSSYNIFAAYYDYLTENIDYDAGFDFISGILNVNKSKKVIDLACGTGIMSEKLLESGFSVIGIDLSQEMLTVADSKLSSIGGNYSLIKSEMQNFALSEPADACICCLDSINHLTSEEDVLKTFKNVFCSIRNGGVFIFDVNTVYKHKTALNNKAYIFDEDDFFLAWDNETLENDTVRIILDFFIENDEGLYERHSEEFLERAYSEEDLKNMLKESGFTDIEVYGDLNFSVPDDENERLFFICKKG
ncbi:MAG: class I SAM-dependent methyltransferase [Eubacterium sp.]|nr:class I SAM-dependent methyltransferase [Eubacterium sp.]